jgi:carbonic anhydrase/acetyltransferase-like protein (isoleucine patch superfamily)
MIKTFQGNTPSLHPSVFVSENVSIIGDVSIQSESNIWFGTVIRGDMNLITIGKRTNIQDNATIHVTSDTGPTIIGDEVTIGHNAIVHGCTIENRCLIGMGSVVLDNALVGEGAIIGAGAVVPPSKIIPPRTMWMGVPAKYVRDVSDSEFHDNVKNAQHYIDFANKFKEDHTP